MQKTITQILIQFSHSDAQMLLHGCTLTIHSNSRKKLCYILESLKQGFSNFFSEGPDETPVQPERARTVFGWGGGAEYVPEAHITSAKRKVPCGRGPGPAQGPWKLWGYRCSLMQSQPYLGPFTICLKPFLITFTAIFYAIYLYNNCNNFVIYKMIAIIVIILDPFVLKRIPETEETMQLK